MDGVEFGTIGQWLQVLAKPLASFMCFYVHSQAAGRHEAEERVLTPAGIWQQPLGVSSGFWKVEHSETHSW